MVRRSLVALCAAALVLAGNPRARAETDIIKIPRGAGGLGFLPLLIMEQQGLIERKAREAGIAHLKAEWIKFPFAFAHPDL
jgi:NitT/TauT family transport system substrate-binding protein